VVVLANREPYIHERRTTGVEVLHPASGLVTALEPVMRACSGVWVAHGSGSADRETSTRTTACACPRAKSRTSLRRVWLSQTRRRATTTASPTRALAAVPRRAHAADLSSERLGALRAREPALRRGGVRGGRLGRPHRARAGLPLCARAAHDPRAAAARDDPHLLAHPVAERGAHRHLPVARGAHLRAARLEHRGLPHPAALQQLHRLGRRLHGEPHRPRAHAVVQGDRHARAPLPHLDRVARALARRPPPVAECRAASAEGARPRPDALLGVGIDRSTTPRASKSGSAPSTSCSSATRASRQVHLRAARGPEPDEDRAYQELNERVEALAERDQREVGQRQLPPHRAAARAPRAADRLPLLPRRRALLRQQPARRHEPGRQGVRRRA
jgi:hypothetical protein